VDPPGDGSRDPLTRTADRRPGRTYVPLHAATRRRDPRPAGRAPALVHGASLAVGLGVLAYADRHLWFFGDEWDFLADRGLHHPLRSIWQPHNEHWSTLPILLWRALFSVFGLGTYWPYLLALLVVHLAAAHLIWRVLLEERADPWVATAAVTVFVFFGAGAENLTWAFQIGFVASVAFGWLAIWLAGRRRSAWNEVAVAAALLASLSSSTIGDAMVVAAAAVLLMRRGLPAAVRTVVVPVAAYAVWFAAVGRKAVGSDHLGSALAGLAPYFWRGLSGSLGAAVGLHQAGPVIVVGLAGWMALSFRRLRRESPSVLGGAAGAVAFFVLVGLGRAQADVAADSSRYVYVAAALLLPAMAVAASDALAAARRLPARRVLQAVAVAVGAAVLASNVSQLETFAAARTEMVRANRKQLLAVATLLAGGARSLSPRPVPDDPDLGRATLVRFVRQGLLPQVALGEVARLDALAALDLGVFARPRGDAAGRFTLLGTNGPVSPPLSGGCRRIGPKPSLQVALRPGAGQGSTVEVITPRGRQEMYAFVVSTLHQDVPGTALTTEADGRSYVVDEAPGEMLVLTLPGGEVTTLCGLAG